MNIKNVLDKYFAGESSVAEERFLKNYFSDLENIDSKYRHLQPLFGYLTDEETGLQILREIRNQESAAKQTKRATRLKKIIVTASSLTAVLIIGLFLLFGYLSNDRDTKNYVWIDGKRTSDPELVNKYFEASFAGVVSDEDILEQQLSLFFE